MSKGFSLRLKPKFNLLSQVYRVVAKIAHGGAVQDARSISSANICRVRIIVTVTRDDCFVSVRNTPNSNEGPGDPLKLELLLRKGVYPYDYFTDMSKFEDELPPRSAFYNSLTETECSPEDYRHAVKVWISITKRVGSTNNRGVLNATSLSSVP